MNIRNFSKMPPDAGRGERERLRETKGGGLKRSSRRDEEISGLDNYRSVQISIHRPFGSGKNERGNEGARRGGPPLERTTQLREIELLPIDPGQRVIN